MADAKPFKEFMKELKKKVDGYFLFTPADGDNATVEFSKKKPKPVGEQIFGTVQLDEERVYITGKRLTSGNLNLIRKAFRSAAVKEVFLTPEEAEQLGIGDRVKAVVDEDGGENDDDNDSTGSGGAGDGGGGSRGNSGGGSGNDGRAAGGGVGAANSGGGSGDGGGKGNDRGEGGNDARNQVDPAIAKLESQLKKALALWPNILKALVLHNPPPDIVAAAKRVNAILRPKGSALSARDLIDHYDFDAAAMLTEALGLLQGVARFVAQAGEAAPATDDDDDDDGLSAVRKGRAEPAEVASQSAQAPAQEDDDEATQSDIRQAVEASLSSAAPPSSSSSSSSAARAPAADDDDDVDDKVPPEGPPQPDPALVARLVSFTRVWPGIVASLTGPSATPDDKALVNKIDPALRDGGKMVSPEAFFARHGANAAKILAAIGPSVEKLRQRVLALQLQADNGDGDGAAQPSDNYGKIPGAASGSDDAGPGGNYSRPPPPADSDYSKPPPPSGNDDDDDAPGGDQGAQSAGDGEPDYGALPGFKNDDQLLPQRKAMASQLQAAWNRDVAPALGQLVQTGTAPAQAINPLVKEFSQLLDYGSMAGGKMAQLDRARKILDTFIKLKAEMERKQKAEMERKQKAETDRKLAEVMKARKPE